MRVILALLFALAACAIPSPADVGGGNSQIAVKLTEFCAADVADANVAALQESPRCRNGSCSTTS